MSEVFENAVTSIRLGIEDFEDGSDGRILSATRNYYAGLILLAKECLIREVPESNSMEIIGARFKPVPDEEGGVQYIPGKRTVDLGQLKERFKDFGLEWPTVNIDRLQTIRNEIEHLHPSDPADAMKEVIAASFPMVVKLFGILKENPQERLEGVWETMIKEREAFEEVQRVCLGSFDRIQWPLPVRDLDMMECPFCHSSLVGQANQSNEDYMWLFGKCFKCGEGIEQIEMIKMVVEASYGADFEMAKSGLSPVTHCPACYEETYVQAKGGSVCFLCGESVDGQCARCGTWIDVNEYNPEYPGICGYCAYQWEKVRDD